MSGASDALQNAAANVLMTALHAAEAGGEWLKGQIPDVLHQLLVWSAAQDGFNMVLCAALVVACLKFFLWQKATCAKEKATYGEFDYFDMESPDGQPLWLFACLLAIVLMVVGGICFVNSAEDLLEIWLAPKVWLLDYAHHLLTGR